MARIRMVKPDTFDDPDLCALPFPARWLFVGLWTLADREGRLDDDPRRLKVRLLPYDSVDCDALLDLLAPRFVIRYSAGGRNYLQIRNFTRHQRPHPKEPVSAIPAPNMKKHGKPCKETANPPESGSLDTDTESGSVDTESMQTPLKRRAGEMGFDRFWSLYPKKVGKGAARASWAKVAPSPEQVEAIIAGIERQKASRQWLRESGRWIPNPTTWLNQQRWDDEPDPDVPYLSDKTIKLMSNDDTF